MHRSRADKQDRHGPVPAVLGVATRVAALFCMLAIAAASPAAAAAPELRTDSGGVPVLSGADLAPGGFLENCVVLTYSNLNASRNGIGMYGLPSGNGLANYLDFTVEIGNGGVFGDCSGFSGARVFNGTLAAFGQSHPAPASQLLLATVANPNGDLTVRMRLRLRDDNRAQGRTSAAVLAWTVGEVADAPPIPVAPSTSSDPTPAAPGAPTVRPRPAPIAADDVIGATVLPSALPSPTAALSASAPSSAIPGSAEPGGTASPAESAGTVDPAPVVAEVQGTTETNPVAPAVVGVDSGPGVQVPTGLPGPDEPIAPPPTLVPIGPPIAAIAVPLLTSPGEPRGTGADDIGLPRSDVGDPGIDEVGNSLPRLPRPSAARIASPVTQIKEAIAQLVTTAQQAAPAAARGGALGLGTLPFLLLFLLIQKRLDERDPKLAMAPSYEDEYLTFDDASAAPARTGGFA